MTEGRIELAEYIKHLRRQITKASTEADGKSVRFDLDSLELELEAVVERSKEGEAGVGFWIVTAGGTVARKEQLTQTIKLKLRPIGSDGTAIKLGRGGAGS